MSYNYNIYKLYFDLCLLNKFDFDIHKRFLN